MAEKEIIQKMISRLGQSQNKRRPEELGIHFADVDERTTKDLLLFSRRFAEFVNFYANDVAEPAGNWKNFFDYDDASVQRLTESVSASTPPHLALFLAFLELYKKPQQIINRITGQHLDFYYKEILRLKKEAAVPDKAFVLIELKKNALPTSIEPQKNLFSAGKGANGVELLYEPIRETVINAAKVDSLRSVFVDDVRRGIVRYAPFANSANGLGAPLPQDEPKWRAFGHAGLPAAEVGFAVASPVLRMQEGTRKIIVTLTLDNVDAAKLNDAALGAAFDAFVTGEKNWLGPYAVSPTIRDGGKFQFEFVISAAEKAVVDYDPAIHGYSYGAAQAPVAQLLLKADATVGIKDFDHVILCRAAVSVEVSGVTSLIVENDLGVLDPKKAFLPFGPQPAVGSRFMVGYGEALAKKLSAVSLTVRWKDAPRNFFAHYGGYGAPLENNGASVSGNDYFTAGIAFNDGGSWHYLVTGQKLFQSADASSETTYSFPPGDTSAPASTSPALTTGARVYALNTAGTFWAASAAHRFVMHSPVFSRSQSVPPEPRQAFIIFSLEKSFLHSTYRKKYVENVMAYSKSGTQPLVILNEPYTPTMQSIALSYKAYSDDVSLSSSSVDDFANPDIRFFHVTYFGQMREHGYQRQQFDFVTDKRVPLLPSYDHEGELVIGLINLMARDSVSVLFQVAEGSANPELDREDVGWFVLCDNYWKRLGTNEVLLDTTNQLLTSGVTRFLIPAEATAANTILPSGRIWLKAGVKKNVAAVCQLLEVAANALEVRCVDPENHPEHLLRALAPGKIAKFKNGLAAVKAVAQPYASFGGRPVEADESFHARVAERLRHKNRCVTAWDYERIVLDAFPKVHKVKCIPHASEGSWLAPGHVLLVVIPDLKNKNAVNPLEPKVAADTLSRIAEHVAARTGMQIKVKVKNPSYQKIQLDFKVKFHAGYEFNFFSDSLKRALIQFLSPWAYDAGRDLNFGGKIYKSVLLDFVEELDYVDYVTDFKMYSYVGAGNGSSDVNEARPEAPDAILVSEKTHTIGKIPEMALGA